MVLIDLWARETNSPQDCFADITWTAYCGRAVPPKVSRVNIPAGTSAGQEAQAILGDGVRVVSAFQNISATHLSEGHDHIDCDVLVCGDDKEAKAEAIALAEAAGMRGIDAGPLQNAVVVEGLTSVLIGINIRHKIKGAGIKITGI
jgi:NADPH-dependent F420 reductase